jgi:hypothetical protein
VPRIGSHERFHDPRMRSRIVVAREPPVPCHISSTDHSSKQNSLS